MIPPESRRIGFSVLLFSLLRTIISMADYTTLSILLRLHGLGFGPWRAERAAAGIHERADVNVVLCFAFEFLDFLGCFFVAFDVHRLGVLREVFVCSQLNLVSRDACY